MNAPPIPRLALTAMEAPAACGVSDDFFREYIGPELRWVRKGRKKLVAVEELQRWLKDNAALTLEMREPGFDRAQGSRDDSDAKRTARH
jgi:hypothetical protein